MVSIAIRSFSRKALFGALLASSLVACKGKKDDASAAASASAAAPAASAADAAAQTGVTVTIADFQLFHPMSPTQSLASLRDNGALDTVASYGYGAKRWGIGFVIEATNHTGSLLKDADFEAVVTFTGATGAFRCTATAEAVRAGDGYPTKFLGHHAKAADPKVTQPQPKWWNEALSPQEFPWRPGERIRMIGRAACGSPPVADLAATSIHGEVKVTALPFFAKEEPGVYTSADYDISVHDTVVLVSHLRTKKSVATNIANFLEFEPFPLGENKKLTRVRVEKPFDAFKTEAVGSTAFDVHPSSLVLQKVTLPSGAEVHAAGNLLVSMEKDKTSFRDAAKEGVSMLDWKRADLPDAPPEVVVTVDDFSARVTNLALKSWTEDATLPKGKRALAVTWKLALPSASLDARLRREIEGAERPPANVDQALDTKRKSERQRLARALACGDVLVVTTGRTEERPQNAAAANAQCATLATADDVEVTTTYLLGRYDVPVALVYRTAGRPTWSPIASRALAVIDPR